MAELPLRVGRETWSSIVMTMAMETSAMMMPRGPLQRVDLAGNFQLGPLSLRIEKPGRYQVEIEVDDQGRPHSGSGLPALSRQDKSFWYWHGVEVPEHVVTKPETITVSEIQNELNAEVSRVMIERYGQEKFLKDCHAKRIQKDEAGELFERKMRNNEPVRFVKVKNSTPEADGTFKDYFLRVPPGTITAKEGVAWTFQLREKDYNPSKQT